MRLSGLASGIDTDQMVKELMKAESTKVDRVEGDKQILEWKKEALNSLNKDLANFILDSKKDLGYNSLGRPGNQEWSKSVTSSNADIGTARAGKNTPEGSHTVIVENLVRSASGASVTDVKEEELDGKAFKFKLNGVEIDVKEGATLKEIAKAINDSEAGVNAIYDESINRFFISTKNEGSSSMIDFKAVEDDGNIEANQSGLNNLLETINVKMDGFRKDGGVKKDLQLKANSTFYGADGLVTYNGAENIKITSNQPTFNGITFDIKATGQFTVNIKTDADAIVNKVKDFVENYNKMIEQASNLVKEKQNKNFRPLTSDQREAMSEKEIETWEKKAKSGIANGDRDIQNMLSALRSDLYKNLEGATGKFINISQIGITTQEYKAGSAGGMLQIDEEKLRKAISEDANSVLEVLFSDKSNTKIDSTEGDENKTNKLVGSSEKGLFTRIFDNITDGMKNIIEKSGPGSDSALFRKVKSTIMTDFVVKGGKYSGKGSISDIDDDMLKFTKKIDDLRAQLFRKENMYYAKFTAMEKAMQKANSQMGWLQQQFGGGM